MSGPASSRIGVPPVTDEKLSRRRLPHWQRAGAAYFVTWRCSAGVTLSEDERDIVFGAVRYWDTLRWDVLAAVVMPDHVHALVCPLSKGDGYWELGELIHSVKSFSAHRIAKHRAKCVVGPASRRPSSIWQDERYDRWMRDDEEVVEKWSYIVGNPVLAGLVEVAGDYPWLYEKTAGGTPAPPPTAGGTPAPPQKTGGTPAPHQIRGCLEGGAGVPPA